MTTGAQIALLPPRARRDATARLCTARESGREGVRVAAFAALGLYGALRWATLLSGSAAELRMLGLLVLSTALAGVGARAGRRSRLLLGVPSVIALLVALALAGIPVSWLVGLRVTVSADAIGQGLSALPRLLVPYLGINQWVRTVILLGGGILLLDGAVMLAVAPRAAGLWRRIVAALPLIALAAIPATLVHPRFAYVDGLVLFGLLAAFLFGDRIGRHELPVAVCLCAVAAAAGMVGAPALDRHRPWVDYASIAGRLQSQPVEAFDWSQSYGPITWPRTGQTVFAVRARRPDYWKAEDLDVFDGRGWTSGTAPSAAGALTGVSAASRRRWTQTLKVTIGSMTSTDVVAAGAAAPPTGLSGQLVAGASPGTWTEPSSLGAGDSYLVSVYDPEPSGAQLAGAGTGYPATLLPGYLTVWLPVSVVGRTGGAQSSSDQAVIAPFGSHPDAGAIAPVSPSAVLHASPYARAYALARSLAASSPTPYAYVLAVMRFLSRSYTYNEDPQAADYPLESFLFASKAGYCQQFAGAMALLLRLGGVPARVAVGFTTGTRDPATGEWMVSDVDAHAWVEAFFPGYGWVRFDPTPPTDPALGGESLPSTSARGGAGPAHAAHRDLGAAPAASTGARRHRARTPGAIDPLLIVLGVLAVLAVGAGTFFLCSTVGPEGLVAELERAFSRTGRPLAPGSTLASIERRLVTSPQAQAYVRILRLQRFSDAHAKPTPAQRRALRADLRRGLGISGAMRAWWALPPRRGG